MFVLTILLLILKIIGIIILSVLGFVILVLAVILFAPVFYNVDADFKNEDYSVRAVVSYLAVKVKYLIDNENEGKTEIILTFGIGSEEHRQKKETKERIKKAKRKRAERKRTEKHNAKEENTPKTETFHDAEESFPDENLKAEEPTESKETETETIQKEIPSEPTEETAVESEEKVESKTESKPKEKVSNQKSLPEKVKSFYEKAKRTITLVIKKPKKLYDKVMKYVNKIRQMNDKYNFKEVGKQTFLFFKRFFTALGLKKFQICGIIGLENPADTGQLIALISAVGSFIPIQKNIRGDFQKKNTDLNAVLKGRTSVFAILFAVARYALNENILPIIKEYMD